MMKLGNTYQLEVIKKLDFGFFLDAKELGEVLLPSKYAPNDLKVGALIYVFLYLDSQDRPIATTKTPKAKVGEFAYLNVVACTHVGAFLDWGLEKDILVPFAEQHRQMEVDKAYIVYLYLDKNDGRIVASSKLDKFLNDEKPHDFTPQQQVNLLIASSTDLGFKAIINNSHWGVLYKNDVFQALRFGQSKKGFIKRIRADGKIDLTLQGGKETRDKYNKIILNYLEKNNGFAPVHDKTSPEIISDTFGMSKAAFKRAIGGLYKQRIITISKGGIRLVEKEAFTLTHKQ
ncbi:MAG: GntR family transcriptional regulator [Cycloclasticus sp. symbiont of Poecilosclerida sp. N]|nr:MAG: GntR family transcriptional regulator [Cycloclasticus sp. symbiont of Poecilosclerida sp. N]